ncbi:LOW QUALITY PROTEIN: fidgetin-like [Narcine bancroftii]|uniref:LOW QUALITY PROTEIN: fidgetin-like n=1 Tax=Narcine bancroftii TaxID=1343680 RepID=UPI003831F140
MSSLAHKTEDNHLLQRHPRYDWANDDFSALTASNLLKKYAEKYSGIVNTSCERPEVNANLDVPLGPINEQKNEHDAWQMSLRESGVFSVNSIDDGLARSKGRSTSTLPSENGGAGMGVSPVVTGSPCEPCYPSHTDGPTGTARECSSGYSATCSPSEYCGQATSAVPPSLTSSLNSSNLLQKAYPVPTIVPSYNSTFASINSLYNYPSNHYPSQSSTGPGFTGVHLPPLGVPAPVHLPSSPRPPLVSRYESCSLPTSSPSPVANGPNSALKRKAVDIKPKDVSGYSYGQERIALGSYQMPDDVVPQGCQGHSFSGNGPVEFKTRIANDLVSGREEKGMMSPSYHGKQHPLRSNPTEAFAKFPSALLDGEVVEEQDHNRCHQRVEAVATGNHLEEQLKSLDSQLVSLVTNEIVDCGPPVQWGDIAGLNTAKAVIEEEVLWPWLRPGACRGAPKSILLFGPRGGGKTMLTRCIATHLGATFLKVSGTSFVSKWKGDGEMILQAMFLIARSRQPAVIFISELDVMLSHPVGKESIHLNSIKAKLLSHVEGVVNSSSDHILVIGGTRHPDDIEETIHRYFIKRLYISPPPSAAQRQILICAMSQHCLSNEDIGLMVQDTGGGGGGAGVVRERRHVGKQLSGEGMVALLRRQRPPPAKTLKHTFRKFCPSISRKELKVYTEWSRLFGFCA